jgi:hypothetical protein
MKLASRLASACLAEGILLALPAWVDTDDPSRRRSDSTEAVFGEQPWSVAVYEKASGSVVAVESGAEVGSGFFFHTERHVVTAYHVIEKGRSVMVATADGQRLEADVVAWDSTADLAILHLRTPAREATPLLAGNSLKLRIGQPAMVIGVPSPLWMRQEHGSEDPIVTPSRGIITARSERAIQTDAAVSPGSSGGPLLDEDGRVVGIMVQKLDEGLGLAAPVEQLRSLTDRIGQQGTYFGTWAPSAALGYMVSSAPEGPVGGFALGVGVRAFDRFELLGRLAFLSGWSVPETGPTVQQRRTLVELGLSYRLSVFAPGVDFHFPLGLGAAFLADTTTSYEASYQFQDPDCIAAGEFCDVTVERSETHRERQRILPMVSLGWEISILEIGTALYIDPKGDDTTFRAVIGLHF